MAEGDCIFKVDLRALSGPEGSLGEAFRTAAPRHLARALGRALYKIGRSDIEKLKREQLSGGGGKLNVGFKGLRNAFKSKASDSRKISSIRELTLQEYTGWKLFRVFQVGGTILPRRAKMLTVLTAAARRGSGRRKYTQKEIRAALKMGEMRIVQTRSGPMIVREVAKVTKKGKLRKGSRTEIIAFLQPRVKEEKRLSFFENFQANRAEHDRLLREAGRVAMEKTVGQK